jgi:hypothetical protein
MKRRICSTSTGKGEDEEEEGEEGGRALESQERRRATEDQRVVRTRE